MAITIQMRTDVSGLYVALFGRAPDSEGLGYWVQQVDQGQTLAQVADAMYGTAPARTYYPSYLTNQEIISNFYVNVLGRPADAEGLAYWTNKLGEPGATPGSVIADMINVVSNYDGTDPAGLKSAALFTNKVAVAQWYGEHNGSISGAAAILTGVTEDPATVEAITNPGTTPPTTEGQTFALNVQSAGGYWYGYAGNTAAINAKDMLGLDKIASVQSDASLFVTNLTTLTDTGNYADRRNTDSITIRMDHTAPDMGNPDAPYGRAADMTVLFDNDYLLAGTHAADTAIYWLEDRANAALNSATPVKKIDIDGLKFTLNGATKSIAIDAADMTAFLDGTGPNAGTWEGLVALLQKALVTAQANDPSLANLSISLDYSNLQTKGLDGTTLPVPAPAIVLSAANGDQVTPTGYHHYDAATGGYDVYGFFSDQPLVSTADPVTSNIELFKVGRGAEGGNLTVGGMSTDGANVWDYSSTAIKEGVEVFNVKVQGDQTQMSSLASLQSTNNTLAQVHVTWDTNSLADLIIGNHNTTDTSTNHINGGLGLGLTSVENAALKDVRVFDAADNNSATLANGTVVTNDVQLHAYLSDEVVAKYMDRTDTADDALLDNANFQYTFGAGNDLLNMNISKTNLEASGTTNREDFSFTATMGSGDDHVQVQIGNGAGVVTDAWYINSKIDNNLAINAGAGADTVETWGAGAWNVNLGDGNDVIYNDNSGDKGVWVFNTSDQQTLPNGLGDLESGKNDKHAFYMANVTVNLNGVKNTVQINSYSSSDTGLNNAIKNAINNDTYLSKLLVAEDGPGATLVVHSLVDGNQANSALQIDVVASTLTNMSPSQIAAFNTANGTTCVTMADVQAVVNASVAAWTTQNDGVFGPPDNHVNDYSAGLIATGGASVNATASVITDGAGTDVIVLSTSNLDKETVNLTADGQSDLIYNVTNATINGLQLNDVIVTSAGTHYTAMLGTATFSDVTTTTSTIVGSANADTIHGLDGVTETIDAGAGNDTVYVSTGADQITLGAGSDTLVFSKLVTGADAPRIADYSVADDSIQLSKAAFAALGPVGALSAAEFEAAAGGLATAASTRIVYDTATGDLSYDADGSGAGTAVVIAHLTGIPTLTAAEFTIVA